MASATPSTQLTPLTTTAQDPEEGLTGWLGLPREVKANIFGRLTSLKDLRNCRLIDRRSSPVATQFFFNTVRMYPSLRSTDYFGYIAEKEEFAASVRVLELHRHLLAENDIGRRLEVAFRENRFPATKFANLSLVDAAVGAARMASEYHVELSDQESFWTCLQHAFDEALPLLPNIQTFIYSDRWVRGPKGDLRVELAEDTDLAQRTGMVELDRGYRGEVPMDFILQVRNQLKPEARANLQPSRVEILSISCEHLLAMLKMHHEMADFLQNVSTFKLTLDLTKWTAETLAQRLAVLNASGLGQELEGLGRVLPCLKKLSFGYHPHALSPFLDARDEREIEPLRVLSSRVLNATLPGLTALTLSSVAAYVEDISEFVARHAATLKSLRIVCGAMLLSRSLPLDDDCPAPSLVMKLILLLHGQKDLRLERVELQGRFQNAGRFMLQCGPNVGQGSILHDIHKYICHRGGLPFEIPDTYLYAMKVGVLKMAGTTLLARATFVVETMGKAQIQLVIDTDESWTIYLRPLPFPFIFV